LLHAEDCDVATTHELTARREDADAARSGWHDDRRGYQADRDRHVACICRTSNMTRLARTSAVALLLSLAVACGDLAPTGSSSSSPTADGGGAPGADDAGGGRDDPGGPGATDAASNDAAAAAEEAKNLEFLSKLNVAIHMVGERELPSPAASTRWSAQVIVYDPMAGGEQISDAIVKVAATGGALHALTVQDGLYALADFATGEIPEIEITAERGKRTFHDRLRSPGVHSFQWTNHVYAADTVQQTVQWTPSGGAGVVVTLKGSQTPQTDLADVGMHFWNEPGSPTTGTTPVEVWRSTMKPYNADSYASVLVRVHGKV
jgi:hypothetical protein